MDTERAVVSILLVLIVLSAGCGSLPPSYNVSHGGGELSVSNGTFRMTGEVGIGYTDAAESDRTFKNVSVGLYDSEQRVIKRVVIGELSTGMDGELEINITSETIPKYVVFESPDFWTIEEKIHIESFVRTESGYDSYRWSNRSQKFKASS